MKFERIVGIEQFFQVFRMKFIQLEPKSSLFPKTLFVECWLKNGAKTALK